MEILQKLKNHIENNPRPLIVILGPTASGKTALSIKLAKKFKGEIISTDSRQIYQEMNIGTDAILPEEQEGVPHYMLNITTPDKTLTLAEYLDQALQIIEEIYQKGHIPMLVGGTGLYISAIMEGYDVPRIPPDPELRQKLEKEAEEKGPEALHKQLQKIDPQAANKIHPHNIRYVIRAIEKAQASSSPQTQNPPSDPSQNPPNQKLFQPFLIGINWPREELYERVHLRVDRQIERGVLDEVKALIEKGYAEGLPSMSSLGVKEYLPYFHKEQSLEECIRVLKRNTRRYAKRQMTWFRRYDNVNWLNPEQLKKLIDS